MVVPVTAAILLALLAVLVGWPMIDVVVRGAATAAAAPAAWRVLAGTVAVAVASTTLALALGGVAAWAVRRTGVPGRRLLGAVAALTTFAPLGAAALALRLVAGDVGGFAPLVAAQVLTFLPHAFVLAIAALTAVEPEAEDAAVSLGASGWSVLARITLALAAPRLAAAGLAIFVLTLGDFANPWLVGGDYPVLATEIYRQAATGGRTAAALATLLLVPALVASTLGARRGLALVSAVAGSPAVGRPAPAAVRGLAIGAARAVVVAALAPYAMVAVGAVTERGPTGWRPTLARFAFDAAAVRAIAVGLALAVVAAIGVTVLALAIAYVVERCRGRAADGVQRLALLPAALPGPVLGLGYLVAAGPGFSSLVAAVGIAALPLAVLVALTAMRRIDPALEDAAVSLGAGRPRAFRLVVAPLLARPALVIFAHVAGGTLVAVSPAIFLVTAGAPVAAVTALAAAARGQVGPACALATVLLAMAATGLAVGGVAAGPGRPPLTR